MIVVKIVYIIYHLYYIKIWCLIYKESRHSGPSLAGRKPSHCWGRWGRSRSFQRITLAGMDGRGGTLGVFDQSALFIRWIGSVSWQRRTVTMKRPLPPWCRLFCRVTGSRGCERESERWTFDQVYKVLFFFSGEFNDDIILDI